jgi:hypothetical protein
MPEETMSTEPPQDSPAVKNALLRVLRSDSFIEKAFLLILTAVLSGLVVPLVIKSIDTASAGRTEIARAKAKLFDDFSETIMSCEALALDVSWYGTTDAKNVDMQIKAFDRYSERVVDLIARWRTLSARAQTLASPDVAQKVDKFQRRFFDEQDSPMVSKWIKCSKTRDSCDWTQQHDTNMGMLAEANELISELGHDLGLSVSDRLKKATIPNAR